MSKLFFLAGILFAFTAHGQRGKVSKMDSLPNGLLKLEEHENISRNEFKRWETDLAGRQVFKTTSVAYMKHYYEIFVDGKSYGTVKHGTKVKKLKPFFQKYEESWDAYKSYLKAVNRQTATNIINIGFLGGMGYYGVKFGSAQTPADQKKYGIPMAGFLVAAITNYVVWKRWSKRVLGPRLENTVDTYNEQQKLRNRKSAVKLRLDHINISNANLPTNKGLNAGLSFSLIR
jgi:hypothetical protein